MTRDLLRKDGEDYLENIWLFSVLKGIGYFFLQPIFYYAIILALVAGSIRVKRERSDFHSSVNDAFIELRFLFPIGIMMGLLLSIFTFISGLPISIAFLIVYTCMTILLSINGSFRLLSPAFTIGAAFMVLYAIVHLHVEIPLFDTYLQQLTEPLFAAISLLIGFLMIIEGLLMAISGSKKIAPLLRKSKRGLTIGAFQGKRLWLLPILCFLPTGPLTSSSLSWWPVIEWGTSTYSIIIVPFLIGYQQQVQTSLPKQGIKRLGFAVSLLGIVVSALALAGMWWEIFSIAAVLFAIIGRVLISYRHRQRENTTPYYFAPREKGILILDVMPGTPADKLGLKTGETIIKCNQQAVEDASDLYKAIQTNSAFCKLEVLDINGEVRFVQRALYEGEHHELGILYVEKRRKSA